MSFGMKSEQISVCRRTQSTYAPRKIPFKIFCLLGRDPCINRHNNFARARDAEGRNHRKSQSTPSSIGAAHDGRFWPLFICPKKVIQGALGYVKRRASTDAVCQHGYVAAMSGTRATKASKLVGEGTQKSNHRATIYRRPV